MKRYIFNTLRTASLAVVAVTMANCGGDRELPPMVIPSVDDMEANTTIAAIKAEYYDADGYTYTVTPAIGTNDEGEDKIIKARVISSDATGNIFKHIFVEDETGAIQININSYDLYESYQFGQEVYINLTGLYIGGYGRLLQLGSFSSESSSPARMETEEVEEHLFVNGLGNPSAVDTLVVTPAELKAATYGTDAWFNLQSRLVRVNNVYFEEAGLSTLSTSGSSGVSQTLVGEDGNTVVLYTSGYSDEEMYNTICPEGVGDVVAILSFYSSSWQLVLNDLDGLIGFTPVYQLETDDTEPAGSGTVDDPYNVAAALEMCEDGTYSSSNVYIKGIVSKISSIDPSYGNGTYYISDTGKVTNQLEIYRGYGLGGNKFTSEVDLVVGDEVIIYGTLTMYNGTTPEVTTGSSIYSLNGETSGSSSDGYGEVSGSGTADDPYNVAAALTICHDGTYTSDEVYVTGIISTLTSTSIDTSYGNATYYISDSGEATNELEIYRGYYFNGDKFTSTEALQLGDKLVIKGVLTLYGTTAEFTTGSTIISINGQTSE